MRSKSILLASIIISLFTGFTAVSHATSDAAFGASGRLTVLRTRIQLIDQLKPRIEATLNSLNTGNAPVSSGDIDAHNELTSIIQDMSSQRSSALEELQALEKK